MVRHSRRSGDIGRYNDMKLVAFPYVIVRVECPWCQHRKGRYRLARLVAEHGADIYLNDLLDVLAANCAFRRSSWERPPGKYEAKCGVRFTDLEAYRPRRPDVPR